METPTPPQPSETPRPRGPILAILGGVAALLAGVAGAWLLTQGGAEGSAPPASEGGLVIDSSAAEGGKVDPARPLRCFVEGQFVGELTLGDCARRNGVATDALDVGLDATGALAASDQVGPTLAPLPPAAAAQETPPAPAQDAAAPTPTGQTCQRYVGGRWREVAGDLDLNACVQTLFNGHCERPGGASYGRWESQTLRLVAGRVEVSDDDQTFRTLAQQGANCGVAEVP